MKNLNDCKFPRDLDDLIDLMVDMCDALYCLHENRVVHGGIKLSSFVWEGERLKFIDFSKSFFIPRGKKSVISHEVYSNDTRALECFSSVCGFSSDIWALGCIFSYLIYGKNIFPTQKNKEDYVSVLESWKNNTQAPDDVNKIEIPKQWREQEYFKLNNLIMKMFNSDESKRPSILDVKNILLDTDFNLSYSPDYISSLSHYDPLHKVCNYDEKSILGRTRVIIKSKLVDETQEYVNLVMCIYENVSNTSEFDEDSLNNSIIIANVFTSKSNKRTIDVNTLNDIVNSNGTLLSLQSYFTIN